MLLFAARSSLFAVLALSLLSVTLANTSVPTVERIVSLPKLDGTAPTQPRWSPDSNHVAFLWNDHGMPFRDLWIAGSNAGEPMRLTHHAPDPAEILGTGDDLDLAALRERAQQREHRGITDLTWHPDGQYVFYVLDGDSSGWFPGLPASPACSGPAVAACHCHPMAVFSPCAGLVICGCSTSRP
jgi:dipeptidyl-peptidase 4